MRFTFLSSAAVLAAGLLLAAAPARGLIIFGATNNDNLTAPANGAPWSHSARVAGASGVYIGYGYVLTATHVGVPESVIIGDVSYTRDTSFAAVAIPNRDLRIFKILNPPALPPLPLTSVLDSDLGKDCTLISFGRDKGAEIKPSPKKGGYGASARIFAGGSTRRSRAPASSTPAMRSSPRW